MEKVRKKSLFVYTAVAVLSFCIVQAKQPVGQASSHKAEQVAQKQDHQGFFRRAWQKLKGKKNNQPIAMPDLIPDQHKQKRDIYEWSKICAEVFSVLEVKAWRPVDFKAFVQRALSFGVSQVDAHSSFFSQESYQSVKDSVSGEFSGIGVSIIGKQLDDECLALIDVIEGGPAYKAGLKAGDKITEVNGEKLKGLSSDEVVTKLKGPCKSTVKVKYLRNKKPYEVTITRDIIKDQHSTAFYFKSQGVYYLSLRMFADNSAEQVAELLKRAHDGKGRGVILDLRRNPGGVLESAIEMAGLFLANRSLVVSTKKRDGSTVSTYYTSTEPTHKSDVPLVVLTDNFTASAAEILAGALQYYSKKSFEKSDHKKHKLMVFLLGTQTFGKGSVQEVIPLSNGCAMKLTTMLYYLPENYSLQAVGIKPDFIVNPRIIPTEEIKWIEEMYGKESSLRNHITTKEVALVGKKEALLSPATQSINNQENTKEKVTQIDDLLLMGQEKKETTDAGAAEEINEKNWHERQKQALLADNQVQAAVNLLTLYLSVAKESPQLVSTREKALEYLRHHFVTDDLKDVEKISS